MTRSGTAPSLHADDSLAPLMVLLVDDDEHWTWATKQLLERENEFAVRTAHSLAAGRDRFADLDPDCVVCDYDLGDGDGLGLLDAVRETDPDRPFVLVTGKGDEGVASDAIERGVTDYVRKGRDDEDDLLASRIRNLVGAYRSRRALDRQRRTKTAVLDVLRETANETALCREFCRRLADSDSYALAWIGTTAGTDDLLPRASAGRDGYLDELVDRGALPGDEPARVAGDRNDTVVALLDAEEPSDGWRDTAEEYGFGSVVAAPIRYDGVSFGVLAVYLRATRGALETSEIEEYAESVGYALRSLDRKRSLLSAQPVRVDVTVSDPAAPLVALSGRVGPDVRITSPSVVTRDDGATVYLAYVRTDSPTALEAAGDDVAGVSVLDVDDGGDRPRCTVAASGPTPEGTLVDHGARFERTVVEDGVATVSTHVRDDGRVARIATAVERRFDDATVSTVWTDDHASASTDDPFARLTDRQREVLRHAYHAGYFERPRGATATETAERLGISRQTFAQHLRAAQRKVFGAWQSTGGDGPGE